LESRQVTLLKKGYTLGRLDFTYTQKFSKLRESYILGELEKETMAEVVRLRLLTDAAFLSGINKAADTVYKSIDYFIELTLPYMNKSNKISNEITAEEKEKWKAVLKEKNKQLKEKNKEK
jgi:hypothetical protein